MTDNDILMLLEHCKTRLVQNLLAAGFELDLATYDQVMAVAEKTAQELADEMQMPDSADVFLTQLKKIVDRATATLRAESDAIVAKPKKEWLQ